MSRLRADDFNQDSPRICRQLQTGSWEQLVQNERYCLQKASSDVVFTRYTRRRHDRCLKPLPDHRRNHVTLFERGESRALYTPERWSVSLTSFGRTNAQQI